MRSADCVMRGIIIISFCMACMLSLCACQDNTAPAGIVASVNGEPIALHSIQGLVDSRTASMGIQTGPAFGQMQKNYGRALGLLIVHALVRQELAESGRAVTPEEVEAAIQEVSDDYGEGGLEKFLDTSFIRMEDWRNQMRDHLSLEIFKNEFLLPRIHVDVNEAREYYNAHKSEFAMPDNLTVCLLTAESQKAINDWCGDAQAEKISPGLISQCVDARVEDLPREWQKEIKSLHPGQCARPREENGEWQAIALLSANRGRQLEMAEVYALIESILLEKKRIEAFDKWLAKRLESANIKISPELRGTLDMLDSAEPSTVREAAKNGGSRH